MPATSSYLFPNKEATAEGGKVGKNESLETLCSFVAQQPKEVEFEVRTYDRRLKAERNGWFG